MKKLIIAILSIIILKFCSCYNIPTANINMQEIEKTNNDNKILIGAGFSIPNSPDKFSDYWKTGLNLKIGYDQKLNETINLNSSLLFNHFDLKENKLIDDIEDELDMHLKNLNIEGGNNSIIMGSFNFKIMLYTKEINQKPYLLIGVGYSKFSYSNVTLQYMGEKESLDGDEENAFCINYGIGFYYKIKSGNLIFIESKLVVGFRENDTTIYIPLTAGITFK